MNLIRLRLAALFAALAVHPAGAAGHLYIVLPLMSTGLLFKAPVLPLLFRQPVILYLLFCFATVNAVSVLVIFMIPGSIDTSRTPDAMRFPRGSQLPVMSFPTSAASFAAHIAGAAVFRKAVVRYLCVFFQQAAAGTDAALPEMAFFAALI